MPDKYTEEQVERALRALVLADGNVKLAQRRLEADGLEIPERTLRDWRSNHAARISALTEQRDSWVPVGHAEALEGQIADIIAMNQKFIDAAHDRGVKEGDNIASIGKSIQSNNVSLGILIDKVQNLRGRPTTITEDRTLPALIKALSKFEHVLPGLKDSPLIGTAEEIPPKQRQLKADSSLPPMVEADDVVGPAKEEK